jgi:YegS/Rv2252/BmrU family lipid kinase
VVREREPILFIVNPFSGRGIPKNLSDRITKSFHNSRFNPVLVLTEKPGEASEVAQTYLKKGVNKIFAVGGDGTVNEVGKALVNTDVTMGIIPIGSGNGLARHLRIPLDVAKAARIMYKQKIALIDYGLANKNPFFCTAGLGFDAQVGARYGKLTKRGFRNYFKATLSEYFNYEPGYYKLRDNGYSMEKEAFLITIANASQFGNNAYIAPEADITDGLLDVTVISPFPRFMAPSIGIKLFTKKLGKSKYVEMFRMHSLEIQQMEPKYIHLDGEPQRVDEPIKFTIKPLGLKVYVP